MTTKVWDATVPDESAEDTADVLVADLPCSGLGVLRKKTDIRYKMSRGQQEELEELQRRILDTICSYVKKDGIWYILPVRSIREKIRRMSRGF